MRINWIELSGYLASALVFLAFYMKTMIPLRLIGMLSNVAFMTYGLGEHLYPVFILHAILLPLNCLRLFQMRILIQKVRAATEGELSMEWLVPMMRRRQCAKGDVLFRRGGRYAGTQFFECTEAGRQRRLAGPWRRSPDRCLRSSLRCETAGMASATASGQL